MMSASVGRMSALIDDVLNFARARLGDGLAVERQVTGDLKHALEEVVEELRSSQHDRQVRWEFAIASKVHCDNASIAQCCPTWWRTR